MRKMDEARKGLLAGLEVVKQRILDPECKLNRTYAFKVMERTNWETRNKKNIIIWISDDTIEIKIKDLTFEK